jgi:MarR family transcriptional regulator, organic hydroperoxide resistance regulator
MENNSIDFEKTISFLFAQVTTGHKNRLEKKMNEIGLHSGQVFVLFELWKKDGQSQVRLAERLNVAPPTVNKMLKGLADNGFLYCAKDEDDGRTTRAYLRDRGEQVRELIEDQWRELEDETLANLTEVEKLVLFQLLGKLHDNYFGK